MQFGEKIKELRESQGLLQRQIAASLEIDTPMYSKIERGDRKAKREQVVHLAKLLNANEEDLLTLWLAEKVYEVVKDEQLAFNAMNVAQAELKLKTRNSKKK